MKMFGLSALMCVLLAGCAATGPRTVEFPGSPLRTISPAHRIGSWSEATAHVAAVFERELGFAPFAATLHFFPDRRSFEAALLDSGYDPGLAQQTARVMAAIGGYRQVFVNEATLVPLSWPERLALLAHELTHTYQYELGGGRRGASDQWLREGFAEWVSMRVLDRTRAVAADEYRRRKLVELRATRRQRAPRLDDMATFPQMVALAARGDIAPYAQSFVAVDTLIERHGLARTIKYFELSAASADRAANFLEAFGEDSRAFEASLFSRVWR